MLVLFSSVRESRNLFLPTQGNRGLVYIGLSSLEMLQVGKKIRSCRSDSGVNEHRYTPLPNTCTIHLYHTHIYTHTPLPHICTTHLYHTLAPYTCTIHLHHKPVPHICTTHLHHNLQTEACTTPTNTQKHENNKEKEGFLCEVEEV